MEKRNESKQSIVIPAQGGNSANWHIRSFPRRQSPRITGWVLRHHRTDDDDDPPPSAAAVAVSTNFNYLAA